MTTTGQFLYEATNTLQSSGIPSARLDVLVLMEDALETDRAHLLAHLSDPLPNDKLAVLHTRITQRKSHLPLAYILGHAPFYGRRFTVSEHVLVPRPETETMIDMLKRLPLPDRPRLADIGTGSGSIGITAGLELPGSTVHLYDLDKNALYLARHNTRRHALQAELYQSDLLTNWYGPYDAILTNLPYVPDYLPVNKAASFEPRLALFAGADGMDLYKRFWRQVNQLADPPRFILTESLAFQHHALALIARKAGYVLSGREALIQTFERG